MLFNEMLVNRINKESFPDDTNSVIIPCRPDSDITYNQVFFFKKDHIDTEDIKYNILKTYLIEATSNFFDNQIILDRLNTCIKDTWKVYNDMGNNMWATSTSFGNGISIVVIEYEQIKEIYKKDDVEDTYLISYQLVYKEKIDKYLGSATFSIEDITVTLDIEYTKKPTEKKFVKDITNKFYEEYNIEIQEEEQ